MFTLQGLAELAPSLTTILTDPKKMENRELFQTVFLLATPSAGSTTLLSVDWIYSTSQIVDSCLTRIIHERFRHN